MIFITNESELKFGTGTVALYFYADWLQFHKKMMIMISKVEESNPNINFFAIDIESFKNYCTRFKVTSIPTVLILGDGGKEVDRIVGLTMTKAFKKVFSDIDCKYKVTNKGENNEES